MSRNTRVGEENRRRLVGDMGGYVRFVVIGLIGVLGFSCNSPSSSAPQKRHVPVARHQVTPAKVVDKPAVPAPPEPPAVPRTTTTQVKVDQRIVQVYLENDPLVAHRRACKYWHQRMPRMPRAAALMGGYQVHPACASLSDPPEYRTVEVVSPEWLEYERRVAAYQLATVAALNSSTRTDSQLTDTNPQLVTYQPATSSVASSKAVHVKGHYRKDGTYVRPHTRSKPKK